MVKILKRLGFKKSTRRKFKNTFSKKNRRDFVKGAKIGAKLALKPAADPTVVAAVATGQPEIAAVAYANSFTQNLLKSGLLDKHTTKQQRKHISMGSNYASGAAMKQIDKKKGSKKK